MATTSTTDLNDSAQFHKLARRLTHWRTSRRPGCRIPEDLWRAATRLARTHGVSPVSTALRLGYYELQRRLAAASATTGAGGDDSAGPHFIPLVPHERHWEGRTLEVLKPCGQRLILRLADGAADELVAVLRTFLRPEP